MQADSRIPGMELLPVLSAFPSSCLGPLRVEEPHQMQGVEIADRSVAHQQEQHKPLTKRAVSRPAGQKQRWEYAQHHHKYGVNPFAETAEEHLL